MCASVRQGSRLQSRAVAGPRQGPQTPSQRGPWAPWFRARKAISSAVLPSHPQNTSASPPRCPGIPLRTSEHPRHRAGHSEEARSVHGPGQVARSTRGQAGVRSGFCGEGAQTPTCRVIFIANYINEHRPATLLLACPPPLLPSPPGPPLYSPYLARQGYRILCGFLLFPIMAANSPDSPSLNEKAVDHPQPEKKGFFSRRHAKKSPPVDDEKPKDAVIEGAGTTPAKQITPVGIAALFRCVLPPRLHSPSLQSISSRSHPLRFSTKAELFMDFIGLIAAAAAGAAQVRSISLPGCGPRPFKIPPPAFQPRSISVAAQRPIPVLETSFSPDPSPFPPHAHGLVRGRCRLPFTDICIHIAAYVPPLQSAHSGLRRVRYHPPTHWLLQCY